MKSTELINAVRDLLKDLCETRVVFVSFFFLILPFCFFCFGTLDFLYFITVKVRTFRCANARLIKNKSFKKEKNIENISITPYIIYKTQ